MSTAAPVKERSPAIEGNGNGNGSPHGQEQLPRAKQGRGKVALAVVAVVVLGVVTAAALYWLSWQGYESTDDATVEGRVIPISPQVSARVQAVPVNDNERVHRGDVLVELDATDYQVALDQARASEKAAAGRLAEAKANVDSAKATRDEAKAALVVAEANAQSSKSDYDRYLEATHSNAGAVSKQQMDSVTASWRSTAAQVEQARAKQSAAEAQITTAAAAVDSAEAESLRAAADSHRAQVNLSYCSIKAPEDGRITRKSVEAGSYVQTGQSLFAIVPDEYWIVANFKETQLDHMHKGQPVKVHIDAYPDHDFRGKVDSIQAGTGARFSVLPPENATGNFVKVVQRIPVKILLDAGAADAAHPLAIGMSVVPQVQVK